MPAEVGANPQAVTLAEIQKNILADLGWSAGIPTTEDGWLHSFDTALWSMRNQSARDKFEAPWGATFTVASCVTVANSKNITTASSITSVAVGQYVTGTGIPAGAFVVEVGTGAFNISKPATAAGTVTLTFYPPCVGETTPRSMLTSVTIATATTTQYMSAISLPINATISNFWLMPGTTGDAGPTHSWMGLWDGGGNQLATSADSTTALVASTPFAYPVAATNINASGTSFATTYSGLHYIGFSLVTSNAPVLCAQVVNVTLPTLPPILSGTATYHATPPAFSTALGTITPTANRYYFYVT